uniref:Receptor ligand binding region domain-containing protein n=1 Tax=Catharus ustulatus TaxID=91951 RepID=A0A8C3UM67_CATUS
FGFFKIILVILGFLRPGFFWVDSDPVLTPAILDERGGCGRGERLALALARERVNGPGGGRPPARLEVEVFELSRDNQYETTDTMCQILPKGVVSVLGPAASPAAAATVSHICGEKEVRDPEKPENHPKICLRTPKICLLRLEELVRQFLISRESLSVRVLDAEQDPTPLLKEIRDDKVPTIIIDGSAATAGLVLAKNFGILGRCSQRPRSSSTAARPRPGSCWPR